MAKYTIEDMQRIAAKREGRCLSATYLNKRTKLLWECSNGHQWEAIPGSIIQGSWCSKCARGGGGILTLVDMREMAQARKGRCLSDTYVNSKTKLLWECSNGHRWEATPNSVRRGVWCAKCSGVSRLTIGEMSEIAAARGGKCLSAVYVNNSTRLEWECAEGHRWEATPHDVKGGSWCPVCAGILQLTIEEMRALARARGGKCLSRKYINSGTKLIWQCANGHKWKAPHNKVSRGAWCPECKKVLSMAVGMAAGPVVVKKARNDVYEIGRVCVRTKGKDAGKLCVVIDIVDDISVVIEGFSRRKESNVKHLKQTDFVVEIAKGASHEEVLCALARVPK